MIGLKVNYFLCLLMAPLVSTEPDLCQIKLDSISYLPIREMWFFTSGSNYWYVKDSQLPPKGRPGKLPNGFTRADASFYLDWINVCKNVPVSRAVKSRIRTNAQFVVLVVKGTDGNKIIEFDVRNGRWSGRTYDWNDYRVVGRANIEDPKGEIDAMFTLRGSEVYIVQKQRYAGLDFKNMCPNASQNVWAKQYDSQDVVSLANSMDVPFDAITVKDNFMYYFIGSKFWKSKVEDFRSRDGKIVISKGSQQNVSSEFFKLMDCPESTPEPATEDPVTEGNGDQTPPEDNQEVDTEVPDKGVPDSGANSSESPESSGFGTTLLIVIVLVVLVVVALVIGGVVFAMRKKSQSSEVPEKGQTSKKRAPKPNKPMPSKSSLSKK